MKLHSDAYESYKEAEGEWSETIPDEWQEKRVKDIFRLVTEAAPANNDYELLSLYSGIGVRPRKEMEARGNKASSTDGYWIVKKNDIIVNKLLAWMGSVGISNYDGVTSPAYDVLRQVKPDIDPRYYSYLFRTEAAKKIFRKNSRGIMDMRLRLYFDKLGALTIPVPPFETQKCIAEYVDIKSNLIDRKIELLEKKAVLNKKLYKSVIYEAVNYGINSRTKLVDSRIKSVGEIPEHWRLIRLKEIMSIESGSSVKSESTEWVEGLYPIYGGNGIMGYTKEFNNSGETLVIGRVGAKCGNVYHLNEKVWVSDNALVAKSRFNNTYLNYMLSSFNLNKLSNATAQPLITGGTIRNQFVALPDTDEANQIVNFLELKTKHFNSVISSIELQISKLYELRIAMIYDAITGKIKVADIHKTKEVSA